MGLIIDMAMPVSCYFCCLANERFDLCRAVTPHRVLEDDCEERRPEWCPLKEVDATPKESKAVYLQKAHEVYNIGHVDHLEI